MDRNNYEVFPRMKYTVVDNGTYAPIGSKPLFLSMKRKTNLNNEDHPYVKGYVINDLQPDDEDIPESKVLIDHILETREFIVTFQTSVQIAEDSWKVVNPSMKVTLETTVAEITAFFDKHSNRSNVPMEIKLIELTV